MRARLPGINRIRIVSRIKNLVRTLFLLLALRYIRYKARYVARCVAFRLMKREARLTETRALRDEDDLAARNNAEHRKFIDRPSRIRSECR